jgi:hypothetical protein
LEPLVNADDSAFRMTPEMPRVTPEAADPHRQAQSSRQQRSPASAFARTGANNAVQGMMWAEVFGPPRSKKPHTTRR